MPGPHAACCPLCGCAEVEPGAVAPEVLRRCCGCSLVWRSQQLEVKNIYDETYFAQNGRYGPYFDRADQWQYDARLRVRWLTERVRPSRLLEVGSAGGFFLHAAQRVGIDAHGVEPTPNAVSYARHELGASVTHAFLEDAELPSGFDAVCAFHVLEHVSDPRAFLVKAHQLMAADGVLALEVPNIVSERFQREGLNWEGLLLQQHLWHFSPQTLRALVEDCGFRVRESDTVFCRYYFQRAIRPRRSGLANLYRDWQATKSLSPVHRTAGDFLRLLATKDVAVPGSMPDAIHECDLPHAREASSRQGR